jgi:DNA-binding transcriptional ArsR family regulator
LSSRRTKRPSADRRSPELSKTDAAGAVERFEELDTVVSALAHRTRRHILLVIHFRGGEMTAGEIAERFSCAWPTVSRHLKVLERAELILHEKRGRSRVYRLDSRKLRAVEDWLRWFSPKAHEDAERQGLIGGRSRRSGR